MDDLTFNKEKGRLNKLYFEEFGVVPCMQEFDCSRDKYIEALKIAISSKTKIEKLLPLAGKPINKDTFI